MSDQLGSWTRTLNEEDAVAVLLDAAPGQAVAAWAARAHEILPQAGRARRLETIRMVRDSLLDLDGDQIAPSAWLRLFHEGSPARRLGLLYGRLHARRPWILRAVSDLVLPHLARADEPLAPHEADLISSDEWGEFFTRHLSERTPAEAARKTRWIVQRNLAELGVLAVAQDGARETRARHGEPDPLAFGWLVWHELRLEGRTEAPEAWAAGESIAARIFATRRSHAERGIEAAIGAGLLRRGYLAGMSRLHPAPEVR